MVASKSASDHQRVMKYVGLVSLTFQNVALVLIMRYARTRRGDLFLTSSAVVMGEWVKLVTCLIIILKDEGWRVRGLLQHLNENIIQQPLDCVKISVPALIYVLQNNLLYVAVSNLEAATFQVTYQLKILTTALFSVVLLNKQLSPPQWVSLILLFIGVSAVQLQPHDAKATDQAPEQNPLVGLIAVIVSAIMSGFAGVYFEKILKGTKQTIWLRNVQLGSLGIVFGSITMVANDWQAINEKGFFFGYDIVVWIVVLLNSLAGLLIAIVIKYADNILKGFATSAAIILSCIASIYLFDFQLSPQFLVGTCFVMTSVYMYSKYAPVAVVDPSKPMMKV